MCCGVLIGVVVGCFWLLLVVVVVDVDVVDVFLMALDCFLLFFVVG